MGFKITELQCECGVRITGSSEKMAEALMKAHKAGKRCKKKV